MKRAILALFLVSSLAAFGQGRSGSAGKPAGVGASSHSMGHSAAPGPPADTGKPADAGKPDSSPSADSSKGKAHEQRALTDAQLKSGSFKMLQEKTGMSSEQLQQLYSSSGAKNYGQFVSAVMVSKNLNLDTNAVLEGMKTKSLGQTLKDMGVSEQAANAEIKKANKEVKAANSKKSS